MKQKRSKLLNPIKLEKANSTGLKLIVVFFLGIGLSGLQAQTAIVATGGDATGTGGSISYSVGQVFYTTATGSNGSVAQGVQQPFEISIETGVEKTGINLTASVYPNPTTNYLTLEVKDFELSTLHFQLYDLQGKLIQSKKITEAKTKIVMSNLLPAIYFVKVIQAKKEVKTFKIIKN